MFSFNVLVTSLLAGTVLASPAPAPATSSVAPSELNITAADLLTAKLYDPKNPLHRRDDVPSECRFCDSRVCDAYRYLPLTVGKNIASGTGCFAWSITETSWTHRAWSGADIDDGYQAMAEQVHKDGQFKTTSHGKWTAAFQLFTSAFHNPDDVVTFNYFFGIAQGTCANAGKENDCGNDDWAGALRYYWNRNGDKAYMSHKQ